MYYSLHALSRLGSLSFAIEAYSTAISLDATFLEAIIGRGNAYMDYLMEETNTLSKYVHRRLYITFNKFVGSLEFFLLCMYLHDMP